MPSGEMMAGCMRSVNRLNDTVMGEPVNLAGRLAGRAALGEILAVVTEGIAVGEYLKLELKGFRGRVSAVRVRSVAEKASDVVG
ncbi:MAG: class 3 adenylate cyclase [Verrucomicrobiales bacterium]